MKYNIVVGDISKISADAIIEMNDCEHLKGFKEGEIKISHTQYLNANYLIQVCTPLYRNYRKEEAKEKLYNICHSVLDTLVKTANIHFVLFPVIPYDDDVLPVNEAFRVFVDAFFEWKGSPDNSSETYSIDAFLDDIKMVIPNESIESKYNFVLMFHDDPNFRAGQKNIWGAIVGDYIGSRFEFNNIKRKDFELFALQCNLTDDSIMTLAIFKALTLCKEDYSDLADKTIEAMRKFGNLYPNRGYGESFQKWLTSEKPKPYNSWGNGAAMRVSGCGLLAHSVEEAENLAQIVTEVTHNHPEGIKGAKAVAAAVFLARTKQSIDDIREYIKKKYYSIDFTLDEIRENYTFDVSCQGSVPQALEAFFESTDFEDAIRNAVSIGGDSDTIAAITGSIAGAYYGVPCEIINEINFDINLIKTASEFSMKISENNAQQGRCPFCHGHNIIHDNFNLDEVRQDALFQEAVEKGYFEIKSGHVYAKYRYLCKDCWWMFRYPKV